MLTLIKAFGALVAVTGKPKTPRPVDLLEINSNCQLAFPSCLSVWSHSSWKSEMCWRSIHMFKLVFHIKDFHQGLVIKQRYKLKVTWKWPIQVIRAALHQLITIYFFHRSDNWPESCDNGVILYILCETLHYKVSTQKEIWYVLSCKPLIFKLYDFVFLVICFSCLMVNLYCLETIDGSTCSLA